MTMSPRPRWWRSLARPARPWRPPDPAATTDHVTMVSSIPINSVGSLSTVSPHAALPYEPVEGQRHRHGGVQHSHPHDGPHTHGRVRARDAHVHRDAQEHSQGHDHLQGDHGHSHGLVDQSIKRSREGVRAVAVSLGVLGAAAIAQTLIFVLSGSVALLADLIHNFGDALTALPLGIAFLMRSARAERYAGLAVVAAIFISACVAAVEAVDRLVNPHTPDHVLARAAAGVVGYLGNWIAAQIRTRAGR